MVISVQITLDSTKTPVLPPYSLPWATSRTSANPPSFPHNRPAPHSALVSRHAPWNAPQPTLRAWNGHLGYPSPSSPRLPLCPYLPGQFPPSHHTSARPHGVGGHSIPTNPPPFSPLIFPLEIRPYFHALFPPPKLPLFSQGGGQLP